jgi:hypothetical protein
LIAEEEYIGGVASPFLVTGRMRGYELHATTTRLIGVKNRKIGAKWLAGAAAGGAVGALVGQRLTREQSQKEIEDLLTKKDFEINKEMISAIELKQAGLFISGHIMIIPKVGDTFKIKIGEKKTYQLTLDLIRKFYPEVLKTK